jgi:hypothetical protein
MKKYSFQAQIEKTKGGACIFFPYDAVTEFGTAGRVPVKATFDGIPYRGSLMKYGYPRHMLGVLKGIQEKTGKGAGDLVDVVLWKDEEERVVEIPADLKARLKGEKLLPAFEKLSYTNRKEYCRSIEEAKKEETRAKRIETTIAALKKSTA